MSHSLLLISYMFPPAGGVGVQRALSFARYLPQAGLTVSVLTARQPLTHVYDPGLEKKIPASVRVHRTAALEPPYALRQRVKALLGRKSEPPATAAVLAAPPALPSAARRLAKALLERAVFPDPQVFWVRPSLRQAVHIIEAGNIDSVLITLPPFSLLRFAAPLRRRFPKLRIILDYRDEWLQYHLQELQFDIAVSEWKRHHAARLEAEAVSAADHVVTVTPTWVERFRARYPSAPPVKFVCIPNGYDPDSFRGFEHQPPVLPPLVVAYLGTLYANPVYSPQPYLAALDLLAPEWRARFETRFIGRIEPAAEAFVSRSSARLVRTGFLPQQQAFRELERSHCLLLLIGSLSVHSGKLFEYLATGLPILAIAPRGSEVERVIAETRAGWCVPPDNPALIAQALRDIYAAATDAPCATSFAPDAAAVSAYSRERLTIEFARATGLLLAS